MRELLFCRNTFLFKYLMIFIKSNFQGNVLKNFLFLFNFIKKITKKLYQSENYFSRNHSGIIYSGSLNPISKTFLKLMPSFYIFHLIKYFKIFSYFLEFSERIKNLITLLTTWELSKYF